MLTCSHCDTQYTKWQGRCNECGKWGTIKEDSADAFSVNKKTKKNNATAVILNLVDANKNLAKHFPTNIDELDRVLSGGIVSGSVVLLAGEPGVGKSTLVAQIAAKFDKSYYVSGEESQGQVAMRLKRLKIKSPNISFSNTIDVDAIVTSAKKLKPSLLIIDSIQTMVASEIDSLPGTPTSVRTVTAQLISYAKSSNVPVLLIGQVTKEGSVAGPKTLEHLVDTVLTLEGDKRSQYRILRTSKNRFGNTDEVGIFEMTEKGMIAVANPSAKFLEERSVVSGSVVTCLMEGTRPILVEVQALIEKSVFVNPIRRTSGLDATRLQMLLAIINKRTNTKIANHDVYINVVGGIKIKEHSVDLAICAAIISSIKNKPIPNNIVIFGELGLGGEVRSVPFINKRSKEAKRLGFDQQITPQNTKNIRDINF